MECFDYIVVGGGSSGCVLAARLSEDAGVRVLMIESGRRDTNRWIHIPATFFKVIEGGRDVAFFVGEASAALNNRPHIVPQGHVIGGGSSINAMLYVRGQSQDYDGWSQAGVSGWSFNEVLPVFRDLEANIRQSDAYHGATGELSVSERGYGHPLSWAFIRAAQEVGIPFNADFNGKVQEGVGFYQVTTRQGRRCSAAQAFLRRAEGRPNLKILTRRRVARITFDGKRASGVEMEDGGAFGCGGEVAVCAGAIESPRLLQLSGIGNGAELATHGIGVIADLPGVGENYQDHLETPVQGETHDPISMYRQDKGLKSVRHILQYLTTKTGLLTSNVVECGGFADLSDAGVPDVQFHVLPFMVGAADRAPVEAHGISIGPCVLRPKSRGSIRLRSADPKEAALFDAGALRDPADVELLVRGVRKAIEILEAPSLAQLIKCRHLPKEGLEGDTEALRDHVRQTAKTVFHPAGTCKMGGDGDRMAVLDNELRVRGVTGLRVCDASAMPNLISGNTNAPTMMIAERAARFMRGQETLST
jgi:choline dehydrogenase-like flavoprotein